MGEDMTYTTEPTRAQLAARVRELEARLAVLEPSGFALANSALIQRVHQLEAQNAELLAAAVTNAQDMLALRVECDGLWARLETPIGRQVNDYVDRLVDRISEMQLEIGRANGEIAELRMILGVIDERMGPADATCDEPGITVSEAARRELADMGKIEYTYKVQP